MPTIIAETEPRDSALTQLTSVAAVAAAFPATTLSGTLLNRFKTADAVIATTPANKRIVDEDGDLLAVYFLTAAPYRRVLTQKGKQRLALETSRHSGV